MAAVIIQPLILNKLCFPGQPANTNSTINMTGDRKGKQMVHRKKSGMHDRKRRQEARTVRNTKKRGKRKPRG